MMVMSALHRRADELRQLPITNTRLFQQLRREFPAADRDMLVRAAKLEGYPRGVNPSWTEHGQTLRPTQIRFQAKKKGGAPSATRTRRESSQVRKASPVLPSLPVDDRRRKSLSTSRWTALDDALAALGEGDLPGGDDSGGSAEQGEDVSDYPTILIPASQIDENDYVEGAGLVLLVRHLGDYVSVFFRTMENKLYSPDEKIRVRLEDAGEEE